MDCSLSGSSIPGIFQARVLEWVAISFSRGSSQPGDWTQVSHIVGRRFTVWATREAYSGEEPNCQCKGHRFDPWPRNIPHATEQLSLCTTTVEAHMLQLLKPVCPKARVPQQEKPWQWEAHAPQQSNPYSPQQEKAHEQQWRLSAVKNKLINLKTKETQPRWHLSSSWIRPFREGEVSCFCFCLYHNLPGHSIISPLGTTPLFATATSISPGTVSALGGDNKDGKLPEADVSPLW